MSNRLKKNFVWTRTRGLLSRSFGAVFQTLTIIVAISGFVVMTQGGGIGGLIFVFIIIPIALGLQWIAIRLAHHGRRLMALSAIKLMAVDSRDPVVYLRSFSSDETASAVDSFEWFGVRFGTTTQEERLRNIFNRIGPVVALADQGEDMLHLGAARLKSGNEEWMTTITNLLNKAQLIVMRTGLTPGLIWELRYILDNYQPERFIVLSHNYEEYERFRNATKNHFPVRLPQNSTEQKSDKKNKQDHFTNNTIVIHFGKDWVPSVEKTSFSDLSKVLKNIFNQLGLEMKLPKVLLRAKMLSAVVFIVGIIVAIMVIIAIFYLLIDLIFRY